MRDHERKERVPGGLRFAEMPDDIRAASGARGCDGEGRRLDILRARASAQLGVQSVRLLVAMPP